MTEQVATGALAPPTAKGRATRQAILTAAEEVFGELSYDRASISEITRRAGVAQGTFYVYFPDKKTAFIELVHVLNHNMRRAISEAVAGLASRFEIERVGFTTFFEYVVEHRPLYRVVRESEFVDPETHQWHYRTLAESYIRGLSLAQTEGQIATHVSAETMAWVLMGIAELIGARYVQWEGRSPPAEVVDEVMTFIACALTPPRSDQ
ncbi:MAG: TetR/AcrR family transcriptional regulator [bacterium]|nr:TetR/AcrR family transcriptional regulator [bacterium]MCP4966446.1 TetR/AcrR family transcriptional regulator [bacterium]